MSGQDPQKLEDDEAKAWIVKAYQHVRQQEQAAAGGNSSGAKVPPDPADPPSSASAPTNFASYPYPYQAYAYPVTTAAGNGGTESGPIIGPKLPAGEGKKKGTAGMDFSAPHPQMPAYAMMPMAHAAYAYPVMGDPTQIKPVITLTNCVLYPPPPHATIQPPKEKPPGCKTIFVGGLPDKATEEMIEELFARVGEIHSVRMSKKNFAHVRFNAMQSVDYAIAFSGYRMKVDDKSEKEFSGKLYIDYAIARDDQAEYNMQLKAAGMDPIPMEGDKPLDEHDLRHIIEKEKSAADRKRSRSRERSDRHGRSDRSRARSSDRGRGDRDRDRDRDRRGRSRDRDGRRRREPLTGANQEGLGGGASAMNQMSSLDIIPLPSDMMGASQYGQMQQRSYSPPAKRSASARFSDDEGLKLLDRLKDPLQFLNAIDVLVEWLQRGECNRRSVYTFYNLINAMNGQIRRLESEKAVYDAALTEAKAKHQEGMYTIMTQLEKIDQVLDATQIQRNWDLFSKPQRKCLAMLIQMAKQVKKTQERRLMEERDEDDMDFDSEDEYKAPPNQQQQQQKPPQQQQQQQFSTSDIPLPPGMGGFGSSLNRPQQPPQQQQTPGFDPSPFYQAQINALKAELAEAKADGETAPKTRTAFEKRLKAEQEKTREVEAKLKAMQDTMKVWEETTKTQEALIEKLQKKEGGAGHESDAAVVADTEKLASLRTVREARLIALASNFLAIHTKGASIDYVVSYLRAYYPDIKNSEVEDCLQHHPTVFQQKTIGVGATMEKKYFYVAYDLPAPEPESSEGN